MKQRGAGDGVSRCQGFPCSHAWIKCESVFLVIIGNAPNIKGSVVATVCAKLHKITLMVDQQRINSWSEIQHMSGF